MEIKRTCTATYLIRPARRLVFLPSKTATDYFSFCEEVGCDWAGLLDSFPSRLDTVALLTLPPGLIPEGFGPCAGGIELPAGWSGAVPAGYHTADLEMNEMLFIASPPYEEEAAFSAAIAECYDAHAGYDPALYGYEYAEELAPAMNFGAETATGARSAFPVRKTR